LRGKFLERKTLLKAEKNQHFTALLDLDALRHGESLPVFKSLSGCHLMANGVPGECICESCLMHVATLRLRGHHLQLKILWQWQVSRAPSRFMSKYANTAASEMSHKFVINVAPALIPYAKSGFNATAT